MAHAADFPAASVGYINSAFARRRCALTDNAAPASGANMEYVLQSVDICNSGATNYGGTEFATNLWANTNAVDWYANNTLKTNQYVSSGLIDSIGPNNLSGWTAVGSPESDAAGIKINSGKCIRSNAAYSLSGLSAITIEVRFRLLDAAAGGMLFESSDNWNANVGAVGLAINNSGSAYAANTMHTVHNISSAAAGANNYAANINDLQSHTITNSFSSITNPRGRLFFFDGVEVAPSGIYTAGTAIKGAFKNDYIFIGARNCGSAGQNMEIQSVRIYNRQLSAAEICKNAWVDWRNFGGTAPGCVE